MNEIDITEETWDSFLSLKHQNGCRLNIMDPARMLYGPMAQARDAFVLAQVGQSLDGRIATLSGDGCNISGPEGLAHLHRCRALADAVIVGVGTVKADNPRLSVRLVNGPNPVRVVIDRHGELTGDERLFQDDRASVIVFQSDDVPTKPVKNAEILRLPLSHCGIDPEEILKALAERSLRRVLVEGGARTIARFIDAGLVDRLHVTVSPIIIGSGKAGISLPPVEKLADAYRPATEIYKLGSDILFDCDLKPGHSSDRQGK